MKPMIIALFVLSLINIVCQYSTTDEIIRLGYSIKSSIYLASGIICIAITKRGDK